MSLDDRIRETLERATVALRTQLERDLAVLDDDLKRATAEERERATRTAAEIDSLKRALTDEKERAAQQAAETTAADMRRQAEVQAEIAQMHDAARRRLEETQRAAAEERDRAVEQAMDAAAVESRRQADAQIAQLRETAQKQAEEIKRAAEAQVGELRQTLQAQLEDVRRAAHAQTEEARRTSQFEIEDARRLAAAQVDDVQRHADEQLAEVRSGLEARIEEVRSRARTEIDQTYAELTSVREEAERAARAAQVELERVREEAEKSARASSEEAERAVRAARTELANVREEAESSARAAREEVENAARTARAEAEEIVIAQLAAAHADGEMKLAEAIDRTRTDALQAELARTARLVDSVRRLDDARSLGEALDTLADCAGRHVERAALLVVRGEKLRVHRLAGFGGERPTGDLDLQAAGLAGAVVSTGVTVSRAAVEPGDEQESRQPALPVFAQDLGARHAVAVPIVVGGHVVAVLYADAPRSQEPSAMGRWPAMLEVLARHASRALEALTVQRASGLTVPRPAPRPSRTTLPGPVEHAAAGDEDAARRYARLLVSEIRMYHEPVVDAGRRSRDLRSRLGGEIDRARRLYEERVPQAVRERSDYFEQELIRTLADGDRSLLG